MIIKKYLAGKILHPFFSFSRNLHYSPQEWWKLDDIVIKKTVVVEKKWQEIWRFDDPGLETFKHFCLGKLLYSCMAILALLHSCFVTFLHSCLGKLLHSGLEILVQTCCGRLEYSCLGTCLLTVSHCCLATVEHCCRLVLEYYNIFLLELFWGHVAFVLLVQTDIVAVALTDTLVSEL